MQLHFKSEEDGDAFGDGSTQCGATSESLRMDAPGHYHMSNHNRELKILSVYGKGEGPLAVEGHDTLFTTSEMEALNSLSADHCVATSLDRGKRLVCRMELGVQQQPPGTISIKVEEDISGEDGAASESLRVDAAGSSHMSGHGEELKILSVYGKGEGPLAVGGHDTLFTGSEAEAPSSLSADHSVAKSLDCGERLIKREELTGHRGGRKSRPDVLCRKILPNNAKMIDNMRHHSDEKPYGCEQCVEVFGDHSKLMLHMRTHTSEMPYKCDQCAKSFEVHSSLKRHMMTHTGEKPYKCVQCVKCYADRYNLKLHMTTHTTDGKKPFRCDQCMKCFGYSTSLMRHMRTHNIEMPYKCDQCLKGFVDRSSLKIHMMTHTGEKPYKCEQCLKYFRVRFTLKSHMRTHTGEKPYKCHQCLKCYREYSTLKSHMRTHTGEKPYKCDQCGKGFGARSNLKRHMRTHNGEKLTIGTNACSASERASS
ncbi:zinc finger protein 226-like isoform X1 [Gadus chalcogrammus]|uniref:zinc finger protein 226-like isoform X1 n=1 Tax=Gadus chalcogrammus TaxID=1042646 RepID=UPI0024C3A402|nr:zinc finger protein 226-like isoform X1 [Gadus chalcogrammus]